MYRLSDSVNDLSCGILQQVAEVFLKTALFAGYAAIFAGHRLFEIPAAGAAWAWVACFLGVDFLYYWFHRFSHEVNFRLGGAHRPPPERGVQPHRGAAAEGLAAGLLVGVLPAAGARRLPSGDVPRGVAPSTRSTSSGSTRARRTPGPARVGAQHALAPPRAPRRNPKYIDRNHGGTLIVWDRLFGTFARGGGAGLRRHQAARQLEPGLGEPAPVVRDVGGGEAGGSAARQAPGPLEASGLAAGRAGRARVPPRGRPGHARQVRRARFARRWRSTCSPTSWR